MSCIAYDELRCVLTHRNDTMRHDLIPYIDILGQQPMSVRDRAVLQFLTVIEKAFGFSAVVPLSSIPFERPDLLPLFRQASILVKAGIITSYAPPTQFPDEPPMSQWTVLFGDEKRAGGMSVSSDHAALTAALAEAVERKIWFDESDYFDRAVLQTEDAFGKTARISIRQFASFDEGVRTRYAHLLLSPLQTYTWIRANSLSRGGRVYLPAQIVSKIHASSVVREKKEPMIRPIITTGLATGRTREEAQLSGALEVIERDAFMVMWLNQLSLPRIPRKQLSTSTSLSELLARCNKYRLTVDFVRLCTDAPAYVVCAVVRDLAALPPITVGTSAHSSLAKAAEKALLEALRARRNARLLLEKDNSAPADDARPPEVHRVLYWAAHSRYKKLEFLVRGQEETVPEAQWHDADTSAHLRLIADWCRENAYEFASVPMTDSRANKTPWHIEFVVIPELLPLYQDEKFPAVDSLRLSRIPERYGYASRAPFLDEPHPFI